MVFTHSLLCNFTVFGKIHTVKEILDFDFCYVHHTCKLNTNRINNGAEHTLSVYGLPNAQVAEYYSKVSLAMNY